MAHTLKEVDVAGVFFSVFVEFRRNIQPQHPNRITFFSADV